MIHVTELEIDRLVKAKGLSRKQIDASLDCVFAIIEAERNITALLTKLSESAQISMDMMAKVMAELAKIEGETVDNSRDTLLAAFGGMITVAMDVYDEETP